MRNSPALAGRKATKLSTVILLVLFVAIVGLITWGYFTSSLPAPFPARHRTTPTTASPGATGAGQLPAASPDKPFAYGNVLYTVVNITKAADVKHGTASFQAAGTFIMLPLTLVNQSKEPVTFRATDFTLRDGQGQIFSIHGGATGLASAAPGKSDLFAEALQPGLEIQSVLVFDVPRQASGFVLRINNGYLDVDLKQ